MNTSASQSAPVIVPDTPHRPFVHPELSTAQQKYLASIGLHKKAQRLADIEAACIWYKTDDDSDVWREQPFTSMMRTDTYLAERRATNHFAQYSSFVNHIKGDWFTQATIYFYSPATKLNHPQHMENQRIVREIRERIVHLGVEALDKYVAFKGTLPEKKAGPGERNRSIKLIFSERIEPEKIQGLIRGLPSHVVIKARMEHKSHFECVLRTWAKAGYLGNARERADMELSLQGLQQVNVYGISPEGRGKFALDQKHYATLPQNFEDLEALSLPALDDAAKKYVPRSPKTGKLARFCTAVVNWDVKVEDLASDEWSEISPPN